MYELQNGLVIEDDRLCEILEKIATLEADRNPEYTWDDIGTATLAGDIYEKELRYCPQNGRWYIWDGCWRKQGDVCAVMDKLQTLLNLLMLYAGEVDCAEYTKYVRSLRRYNPMKNIIETMKTVTKLRMSLYDMDTNPYILNTPSRAYDLKSGNVVEDIRQYNITKLTSCSLPANFSEISCPRWYQFIDEIMSGNKEKAAFLRRALGYSILGVNREECMFIAYGAKTRNGKGTLFSAIQAVLGNDYSGAISPDLVCTGVNDRRTDFNAPQPALAKLVGTRFVSMSEAPKDVMMDSASLKTITGRDALTTRDLYESAFDFTPQFTLWLNTNYLPAVTDDTVFSSDRIWVIEFNEHFDGTSQDKDLKELFSAPENRPVILKWLVDGCREYLRDGLNVPECVHDATEKYRAAHDRIGAFLAEKCEVDASASVVRGALYTAYHAWCMEYDKRYRALSPTKFYQDIESRGYPIERKRGVYNVVGLKLLSED